MFAAETGLLLQENRSFIIFRSDKQLVFMPHSLPHRRKNENQPAHIFGWILFIGQRMLHKPKKTLAIYCITSIIEIVLFMVAC
jgi:hypothetical protein